MRFLRQNTAVLVTVGPIIDDSDGLTPLDAATVTGIAGVIAYDDDDGTAGGHFDFTCSASGGDNDLVAVGHCGLWTLELTAAQTNFVGRAILSLTDADQICPTFHEFTVLPANVYDALKGTDKLAVHADEITNGLITAAAIATGAIDADAIADGAIDAGAFAAGAINAAAIADGAIDAATFAAGAINAAAIANGAIDNATFAADVGSTAYATNIIALAADKAIVNAALGTAAELAKVPKSDSNVSWNATALGAIQSECTDALNAYDPPTKAELDTAQGAVTLANGAHGGAAAVITLQTPIVANTTQIEGGDATNALNAATPASVQNIPVDGTLEVTLAATQPAITWAQQTIEANVAGEGALHIVNSNATGEGIHAEGVAIGQTNKGAIGQHNTGDGVGGRGQFNEASGENGIGQYNYGSATGSVGQGNYGISYGLQCNAAGAAVTPAWATHAAADVAALILDTPANLLVTDASGRASANVKAVNDITVDGAGTEGDPWGPAA